MSYELPMTFSACVHNFGITVPKLSSNIEDHLDYCSFFGVLSFLPAAIIENMLNNNITAYF